MGWSLADIPDLSGKTAIVTGGNIGLGFKSSLELARKGAEVIIACRSTEKGQGAAQKICAEVAGANIQVLPLDLTHTESIAAFSQSFLASNQQLDILLNNAGVVNLEPRQLTDSGHEMHMATNHFGHFLLTGHLLPALTASAHSRVVMVSSLAYRQGVIDFTDLDWARRSYDRMKCYGDSKLANLLFVDALNRYFQSKGTDSIALSAHPGLTGTERQQTIGIGGILTKTIASPVEKGVLPQLRACCDPTAIAGDFFGPRFGLFGPPAQQTLKPAALDSAMADQLWQKTEEITGFYYP